MILTLTADVSCSEIIFMTVLIESRKNFPDNIKAARLDGGKTAASSSSSVKRNLCRSDSIVQVRKSQKVDLDAVFSGKHHQSPNENVHTNTIKLLAQD